MRGRSIALWVFLAVSLGLFVWSLALPVLLFRNDPPVGGFTVLMLGWFGVLTEDLCWFANPAYFLALGFAASGRHRVALGLGVLALGLGLLSLRVRVWYFNEGASTPVLHLGPAFPVWMASFTVLLLGVVMDKVAGGTRRDRVGDSVRDGSLR